MILNKENIQSILTCLEVSQAKVELLQTWTQLLHDELKRKNLQHFELVFVQNNPLLNVDDDDDDPDQQPMQENISEPTSYTSAYEEEVVHKQVQLSLSKPIIRPWEEIKDNKHRTCIGYEK
jgi:DNA-directed RNA polymerase specialized sigma54-like protein